MTEPIKPQITPFTFLVSDARANDGRALVNVQILMVTGSVWLICDPEYAVTIGEHLAEAGRRNQSGLILPALSPAAQQAGRSILGAAQPPQSRDGA